MIYIYIYTYIYIIYISYIYIYIIYIYKSCKNSFWVFAPKNTVQVFAPPPRNTFRVFASSTGAAWRSRALGSSCGAGGSSSRSVTLTGHSAGLSCANTQKVFFASLVYESDVNEYIYIYIYI